MSSPFAIARGGGSEGIIPRILDVYLCRDPDYNIRVYGRFTSHDLYGYAGFSAVGNLYIAGNRARAESDLANNEMTRKRTALREGE